MQNLNPTKSMSWLQTTKNEGNGRKLLAIVAFSALGLTVACEEEVLEDQDYSLADSDGELESRSHGSYNTIEECEAIIHKGDGWVSLCDGHGGWGNPNAAASGRTCKQVDCDRNAEHDVSVYFFHPGCYCRDGYTGPDPDEGLDPLPPGCEDARAGKITFCQKNESCWGAGTRTVIGYSCEDVRRNFEPLVCSGLYSDKVWKQMRSDCCYDASDAAESACAQLHQPCETKDDCCKGLECKVRVIGQPPICSGKPKPTRTRISDGRGGAAGRIRSK